MSHLLGTPPKTYPRQRPVTGVFFLHPDRLSAEDFPPFVCEFVALVLAKARNLHTLYKLYVAAALEHLRGRVHLPITKIFQFPIDMMQVGDEV